MMLASTIEAPKAAVVVGWMVTEPLSTSGTIFNSLIYAALTGSIQTVCHIPLVGVYQIPCGFRICFPRGCVDPSVGSHALTRISFGPVNLTASVISNVNASYPPRCFPTSFPFTKTRASKSTAPKCNRMRLPSHRRGKSNVRRYHNRSFSDTRFITPDSADSTGKGTRICVENASGFSASFLVIARSHSPFRFNHVLRTICGRGYSGSAFFGDTSAAHRVFNGPTAACQSDATAKNGRRQQSKKIWILRPRVCFVFMFLSVLFVCRNE